MDGNSCFRRGFPNTTFKSPFEELFEIRKRGDAFIARLKVAIVKMYGTDP